MMLSNILKGMVSIHVAIVAGVRSDFLSSFVDVYPGPLQGSLALKPG